MTPLADRLSRRSAVNRPPSGSPARPRQRWSRGALALAGALLVGILGPGAGIADVAADGATPAPPMADVTFHGRGFGHGVGMSQYGARGRALAGQLAAGILAHYYPGTATGWRSPSTVVRVLLLTGFAAAPARPLTIAGRGGIWSIDGVPTTFPADARLTLAPTAAGATTWTARVTSAAGVVLHAAVVTGGVFVRPAGPSSLLQLASTSTPANLYRGALRIGLTTTALVVNHVALDQYLGGVVPLEMPSAWPTEALKAQAIAARSYALAHLHPATGLYDVFDDSRSQVYRGRKAETTVVNRIIAATSGVVLLSGSSVVSALFHSADGGWTENNENVFTSGTGGIVAGRFSYLRGSSDRAPDGSSYDRASPFATWTTARYTAAALSAILATDTRTNVGLLRRLDLSRRGVSGRLISVSLTGELGTKTVSGNVFVAAFNAGRPVKDPPLRGTLFDTAPIP